MAAEQAGLSLEQQVVRLQALLEASRLVHSTIDLPAVLQQAARIAVLELELEGALFTEPRVSYGRIPEQADAAAWAGSTRFTLGRAGASACELLIFSPDNRALSLYEIDFLEGLVLQTTIAADNAANHQRHLEYARLARDLDAARAIQQSLLPQSMPGIPGYSLAARSSACYQVGGDYLDVVTEPDGSYLMVVADVAGKGLASALVCTAFRSAFRALGPQAMPLEELAARLSQQHWEEGTEARRRYVTAIFVRLDAAKGVLTCVNAGHNPGLLLAADDGPKRASGTDGITTAGTNWITAAGTDGITKAGTTWNTLAGTNWITASGTPLGMMPGVRYTSEQQAFPPGSRLLLYTDGLTEVFQGDEEFGEERLLAVFHGEPASSGATGAADAALERIWKALYDFRSSAQQQDDMTAIVLCRLRGEPGETQ